MRNMSAEAELARQVMELIPKIMRIVRRELQSPKARLTLPQFRILAELSRGERFVGKLAERHGISQPAMSKMVDGLVRRGLVRRTPGIEDRRVNQLSLTTKGAALYGSAKARTEAQVAKVFTALRAVDRELVAKGISRLHSIFPDKGPREARR